MFHLLVLVALLALVYLFTQRRPKDYPPGPYGLPVLGNLLQLGSSPHLALMKLAEKYGPIVSVNFGSYPTIGISDYRVLREALADSRFSRRPNLNVFRARSNDVIARGLLFTETRQWTEQRRFAIRLLKELGFGKTSLETLIQDEILEFLSDLKAKDALNHPLSLRARFHAPIFSVLWSLISGERNRDSNLEVSALFEMSTKTIEENNGLTALGMFIPWTAKVFPTLSGIKDINAGLNPLWKFFGKHIIRHKETYIPGQVRDFIDAYLEEMYNTTDPTSSFYKDVGERSLMTTLLDLFFAGGDTTANTIHWTCLYLAKYQDVQERLQNEIDSVVGRTRMPNLSDESSMPYTCAVIQESLRHTSLVPLAMFHSTTENVNLRGFKIPKDTMVLMNIYSAMHDKNYWGDPDTFRPERFLNERGDLIKHDPMLAFSSGKRVCIGEALARNELFLWITSVFQKLTVMANPEKPDISLEPLVTWILLPPDERVIFEERAMKTDRIHQRKE